LHHTTLEEQGTARPRPYLFPPRSLAPTVGALPKRVHLLHASGPTTDTPRPSRFHPTRPSPNRTQSKT